MAPDAASGGVDPYAREQDALLAQYYLSRSERDLDCRWSADGPQSISPFVPCASSRVPHVLRAARLTADDVLWDLGCGDGRLLHQAACQYGCRCVGVDIDAPCIVEAKKRALEQNVAHLCQFATCDLMALAPGTLRPTVADESGCVDLGEAAIGLSESLPSPTCALIFITSHGLSRLQAFLHGEWSNGGLRIITCVESFANCFDFESEDPLFGSEVTRLEWPLYEAHASHGVYVTPPRHTSIDEWAHEEAAHTPVVPPKPEDLDARGLLGAEGPSTEGPNAHFASVRALLSADDMAQIDALGTACEAEDAEGGDGEAEGLLSSLDLFASGATERDVLGAAEDCLHASSEHRVVHLHRHGRFQARLPCVLERVLARVRTADAARWRLLVGRTVHIRSIEWHVYQPGGAVSAPEHRDTGSLLTLSALLTPPAEYQGGQLSFPIGPPSIATCAREAAASTARVTANDAASNAASDAVSPSLERGDGVVFPSETRHNVSTLLSGERRSFVIELWEGPPNVHNRHR